MGTKPSMEKNQVTFMLLGVVIAYLLTHCFMLIGGVFQSKPISWLVLRVL